MTDIATPLCEVVLLADNDVCDARRTSLDTGDIDDATPAARIGDASVDMTASMLRQNGTSLTVDAPGRGAAAGGRGARCAPRSPDTSPGRPHAPLRALPAPHAATARGAAELLEFAYTHPATGTDPSPEHPH
ncbi:hypothetical protein ACFP51_12720 [Streptomyces pratens]|uniref:Uncharacterized protein n=1 Tax=Streptomyces pratens TaxID=887456 RepID=A0ABW1M2K0_9ACTN